MQREIIKELNNDKEKSEEMKSTDIGDEADHAIKERAQELNRLFSQRHQEKLRAIQDALDRIENNEYGICEECGEDIEEKRLMAVPFTKFCFECQSSEEIYRKSAERNNEEDLDFLKSSFEEEKDY